LRGYGQRDPLKEYQREGYEMFLDMSRRIKEETVRHILLVKLASSDDLEELTPSREQEIVLSHGDGSEDQSKGKTVRRQTDKVGRNAPCPCGSGKKYKKCCGKAA
jgi:preprotein translocase subunit SecA